MNNLKEFISDMDDGFERWYNFPQERNGCIYVSDGFTSLRFKGKLDKKPKIKPNVEQFNFFIKSFEADNIGKEWSVDLSLLKSKVEPIFKTEGTEQLWVEFGLANVAFSNLIKLAKIGNLLTIQRTTMDNSLKGKIAEYEFLVTSAPSILDSNDSHFRKNVIKIEDIE